LVKSLIHYFSNHSRVIVMKHLVHSK